MATVRQQVRSLAVTVSTATAGSVRAGSYNSVVTAAAVAASLGLV